VLVAVAAETLGVVAVAPHATRYAEITQPGESEVRMLAVAPEARGHGVGRRLVEAATTAAQAHGARHLVLSTRPGPDRAAARRLYASCGFIRQAHRDLTRGPERRLLAYAKAVTTT